MNFHSAPFIFPLFSLVWHFGWPKSPDGEGKLESVLFFPDRWNVGETIILRNGAIKKSAEGLWPESFDLFNILRETPKTINGASWLADYFLSVVVENG
jgi:hypothetical protein